MIKPQLRFQEFSGEWEEKKLGNISSIITKGTTPSSLGFEFIHEGINFIKTENINGNGRINIESTPKISSDCDEKISRSRLEENDLLFSIAGTLGRTLLIQYQYLPANTNQALAIIRLKDKSQVKFIDYLLHLDKISKYIHISVTVGAQPNLSLQQISDIKLNLPSILEQQKIASFLSQVDRKIGLLETKQKLWKTYKKGIMQQIFSQKLRFKDDRGDDYPEWGEKEAKEIFYNYSNKNHDGNLPILAVTQNNGIVDRNLANIQIKTSPKSAKSYKKVEPGNFVISLRSFQGGIEYSEIEGIVSPAYTVLKSKIQICDDFYKPYFKKEDFISRLNSAVIGIREGKQISYSVFSEMIIPYPSVEEQQKIAGFLSTINSKTEQVNKELKIIKEFKKGLLQQMFC